MAREKLDATFRAPTTRRVIGPTGFPGPRADVAQLVEQLTRNEQVDRSNRFVGSIFFLKRRGIPPGQDCG